MGQRDRVVVVLWMVVLWKMGRRAERQEPWGCWAVRSFNFRQARPARDSTYRWGDIRSQCPGEALLYTKVHQSRSWLQERCAGVGSYMC